MAAHQLQFIRAASKELGRAQGDVSVGRAVEAVAPHLLLLIELVRQSVEIRVSRQRVMKRRVEHRHVRHGGKQAAHLAYPRDVHRVVQWRERVKRFDLRQHFVGDERWPRKTARRHAPRDAPPR